MGIKKKEDDGVYDRAMEMLRADAAQQGNVGRMTGSLQPYQNSTSAYKTQAPSLSLTQGYNSPLTQQKNDAMNAYLNREGFQYDINTDALYQQYKDKYIQQGQAAMQDTMGQAAALTGGYGSSYAQNVGQQAYNSYLQQLNDVVPELYQMAYDRYQDEGDQLLQRYSMLSGEEAEAFNRWYQQQRDAVADSQWDQSFQYQKDRDAVADSQWNQSFQYQKDRDAVSDSQWQQEFDTANSQWNQSFQYQKDRDAVADSQWDQSFQYQKDRDAVADSQWDQSFQYQKDRDAVADSQWDQSFQYQKDRDAVADSQWQQSFNASKSSGSGSSSRGSSGGGSSSKKTEADTESQTSNPIYGYQDGETGRSAYYIDGKKFEYDQNVSPITGTVNPDVEYGTFNGSNGYQPDNVGGQKLSKKGTDSDSGATIYATGSGEAYTWNASKNEYEAYDGYYSGMNTPAMKRWRSQQFDESYYGGHQAALQYYEKSLRTAVNNGMLSDNEAYALMAEYGLI